MSQTPQATQDNELRHLLKEAQSGIWSLGYNYKIDELERAIEACVLKKQIEELESMQPWINKGLAETRRVDRIAELQHQYDEHKEVI